MAVTLPVILILFDKVVRKKITLKEHLPFWLALALFLLVRFVVMRNPTPYPAPYLGGSYQISILTMPKVIFFYLKILLVPRDLCADYLVYPSFGFGITTWLPLLLLFLLLLVIVCSYTFSRLFFLSGTWFLVTLLPLCNLIPLINFMAERYLYLAVVMDPGLAKPVMLAAPHVPRREPGTMPVEGVSREVIDPRFGTLSFQWRKVTRALGLERSMLPQVTAAASGLYRALIECECIEAEIGSLALTAGGELVALEARLRFDSNALFRHEEIAGLCDPAEFSETENVLRSKRMRYVALGGRIGCVLFDTGSALVMLDHLAAAGARPGGILYLTGRESAEKMAYGITCLLREESFRALIIEVPRGAEVAGRVVSAIRLAVREEGTEKQVIALAASDASAGAAEGLGGPESAAQVVRTAPAAAGAVGRD